MRTFTLLALGLLGPLAVAQSPKPSPALTAPTTVVPLSNPASPLPPRAAAPVKVTPVGDTEATLQGWTQAGGLRAYGIVVPPGGKVSVRLRHPKAGYFRVKHKVVHNLGFIPDRCPSGDPMDCFNNPTAAAIDVYFVVSDPDHQADEQLPYTLEFTRSWKPGEGTGGIRLREQL